MKRDPADNRVSGLYLLKVFYLVNVSLFLLTTLIFFNYLDVILFGRIQPIASAVIIRLILAALPIYLAFGISSLRKNAYVLAFIYHIFFILNGVIAIARPLCANPRLTTPLEIILKTQYQTKKGALLWKDSTQNFALQTMGILVGFLIIAYLSKKRDLFKNKGPAHPV